MSKETPETKTMNLYQKLLKITEEVGHIEKTGRNSMQNYGFIEQAQIVAELRPRLAAYGVFIIPETVSRTVERFTNTKGNMSVHVNVVSRYTVVNADDPNEKFVSEWDGGEAIDTSDKATNKATTASHKYYLMKLFNISDKEDADAESPEIGSDPVPAQSTAKRRISIPQVTLLFNMVKQGIGMQEKGDISNWLQSVLDKSVTELRTDEFDAAMEKVKVAVREDKVMNSLPDAPTTFNPADIPDNINLDDIPF